MIELKPGTIVTESGQLECAALTEAVPQLTQEKEHWLIFGVGSPELRYIGTHFNVGAAVVDLLADLALVTIKEIGPIRSAVIIGDTAVVRLVKPNVIPELASDAIMMAKTKCRHNPNCVVLIYGDSAYNAGSVKIKRKGGASGHKVIEEFNRTFGMKNVIRVRVGVGPLKNNPSKNDAGSGDDSAPMLMKGVQIAAVAIRKLVDEGYSKATDFASKASKGKLPK